MVKRSSYHAPRREQQAAETRAAVIASAHRLFVNQGYEATSIRQIAAAAQVTGQTVYRIFGTKAALLREALMAAYAGDAAVAPGHELERLFADVRAASTPSARVRALGAWTAASYARGSNDLAELVFEAARTDPQVAEFAVPLRERLYEDGTAMVLAVLGGQEPPAGMTVKDIADFVFAVWSPATRGELVSERGWSDEKYVSWMVTMVERMFVAYLDDPPGD